VTGIATDAVLTEVILIDFRIIVIILSFLRAAWALNVLQFVLEGNHRA
jgi:hypothetical protein